MKAMRSISLNIWLPLLVTGLFILLFSLISWQEYQYLRLDLRKSSLNAVTYEMSSLQHEMEREISSGELIEANQALSARGVNAQYQDLVAIDESGLILYATRVALKGQQAVQVLPEFDLKRFTRLQENRRADVRLDTDLQQITAYFPLTLARQADEIRPSKIGALFLVYDLSTAHTKILSQVLRSRVPIGFLLVFVMTILIVFLRYFVTRPIQHLALISQAVAKGDKGVLSSISGHGELADLSRVFDLMSKELEKRETERKKAEHALRKSEALLTETGRMAKVGGWELDAKTQEISWTEETYRIHELPFGVNPTLEETIKYYHPDDRSKVSEAVQKALDHATPYNMELRFITAKGKKLWVHIDCKPVTFEGKTIKLTGTFHDITERKGVEEERTRLEGHLRQDQKLKAIGTLAGGVAHEINNPLTGIMGYAQLISDRLDTQSPLHEFARGILRETDRVALIVRNLLSFARQEKEGHSPANISDILNDTLSLIRTIIQRDQIVLEVDIPDDLPRIKCRSQQIQQVLMNLLTNARDALNARYPKYNPDKMIRVTVRPFKSEGQKWIRTTVEDHGIGIPDDIRSRMFDPFFTTKDRSHGTGLGLSISHGIVKDHRGRLTFDCEAGQYTRFHLDLPVDNGWKKRE